MADAKRPGVEASLDRAATRAASRAKAAMATNTIAVAQLHPSVEKPIHTTAPK